MLTIITAETRRAAKQQLLADLLEGYSVQETWARANIPWHPATIYRLRQRLQADPALDLEDPTDCATRLLKRSSLIWWAEATQAGRRHEKRSGSKERESEMGRR